MDILAKLTNLFRDIFLDESIDLTPQTTANDIDGWDSYAHLNIILAVEQTFDIEITDTEAPTLRNIKDLVILISTKISQNK